MTRVDTQMTAAPRTTHKAAAVLRTIIALVMLVAAFVIVLAAGLPERAAYTGTSFTGLIPIAPEIGAQAPGFTAATLDGGSVTLAARRGRTVVLNFWATWCGPCRVEMPDLQSLYKRAAGSIPIIAVNQGESPETVRAWADELGLTLTVVLDQTQELTRLYHVRGLPSTYVIAPDGIITHIFYGAVDLAALAAAVGIE